MAYQLQEINRSIRADVAEFLAECDQSYAQRVSLAADRIPVSYTHLSGRNIPRTACIVWTGTTPPSFPWRWRLSLIHI